MCRANAGVPEVISASTDLGADALMPALTVPADQTLGDVDAACPQGADVVIVPAMRDRNMAETLARRKAQHARGAVMVSICEGAWLLANVGLLAGRRATTHCYARPRIARELRGTVRMHDSRNVVDRDIITTTGVSAAIPASLALI